MNINQLIVIMTNAFKGLAPKKICIVQKNSEVIYVRVISDIFDGISFTSRFKLLNDVLKNEHQALFERHLYIFEAFTSEEMRILRKSDELEKLPSLKTYSEKSKELN